MRIQNSKSWVKYSTGQAVLGSLAILLCAFAVRYALQPLIEPYAPFHFFIVACLLIAYRFGYKLAFFATLISALTGSYFFVKPYFSLDYASETDVIQFLNFTFVTLVAVIIIEKLQRTIYGRQIVLKILESRHKISLYRENDRIYFSKSNNEAWAVLEEILINFDDIILFQFGGGDVKLEPLFMSLTLSQKPALVTNEWQSLLPLADAALLLSKLAKPIVKSGEEDEFMLHFSSAGEPQPRKVCLESLIFLDKPLKILRLAKS